MWNPFKRRAPEPIGERLPAPVEQADNTIAQLEAVLAEHEAYKAFYWGCAGFPFVTAHFRQRGEKHAVQLAEEYQKGVAYRGAIEQQTAQINLLAAELQHARNELEILSLDRADPREMPRA